MGRNSIRNNAKGANRTISPQLADCEWRLPSGEDLISFAIAAGFAAGPFAGALSAEGADEVGAAHTPVSRESWRRS